MSEIFRPFYVGSLAVVGVALVGSALVPKAKADTWNKMTIVTVNEPIIAGNKVLDPGTYVWKLMDSQANRHVVQIFDKDQRHLQTTILAIPNYRLQPSGHSQFAFWETPVGVPKAVRAWFYPGDNFGQEFAYPKKLVAQLASAAPTPIPMNYREPEPAPPTAQPTPAPSPEPTTNTEAAPAVQVPPAETPSTPAQTSVTTAPAATATPATLPKTASMNPLIGMLGVAFLSMAGMLGLATRKV